MTSSFNKNRRTVCAWAAGVLNSDKEILPKKFPLCGSTLRFQFRASCGGNGLKLTFSNEYGENLVPPERPLELKEVHVAKLLKPGEPAVDPLTDAVVTFSGSKSAAVPAGERLTSDEIGFSFEQFDFIAVTVYFGEVPEFVACHREADCSSWLALGNQTCGGFEVSEYLWSYFSLCRADAITESCDSALVCFGDSITDGAVSTFNGFDAWPDILAEGIKKIPGGERTAVVNTAIAGNAMYGGYGVPCLDRFKRDVLDIPGATRAIILIGTNDIPGAQSDTSGEMIEKYKKMIKLCHDSGIKVYAGTVTPFGNNGWWASELHESIRSSINGFMTDPGSGYDGFIDFSTATADPADQTKLKKEYDSGDGLHPSAMGHHAMGKAAIEGMKGILGKE